MALDDLYAPGFLDRLAKRGATAAVDYLRTEPFPHAVFDDFLPSGVAEQGLAAFVDARDRLRWKEYLHDREVKREFTRAAVLPPFLRDLLHFFNSAPVLEFLENLTSIEGLIPDPYYTGGGLHEIGPGGKLDVHADFNWYEKLGLNRRVNLLLYLNEDWEEEYGGNLELWVQGEDAPRKRILPIMNRCVVFSTTDLALHGHPQPLNCPPGRTRKSLALYYYNGNGRPAEGRATTHSTVWHGSATPLTPRQRAKQAVLRWIPPIVLDVYEQIRGRR